MIRLIALLLFLFSACASVKTEGVQLDSKQRSQLAPYPEFQGERIPIQLLKMDIPKSLVDQYPELKEKQVGLGLYERITDELFDSRRFEMVESDMEVQKRIVQQWALSQSGLTMESEPMDPKGLKPPKYLLYAQIREFNVSHAEKISGIKIEKQDITRVGIQLRLVSVQDASYIPASGTGEAATIGQSIWINPETKFDQTTVGMATQRALRKAVLKLLKRLQ